MSSDRDMLNAIIVKMQNLLSYSEALKNLDKSNGARQVFLNNNQVTKYIKLLQDIQTEIKTHLDYWGNGNNRK
jgi:hypothetical protein